jgi:hypothetical protein
VIVTTGAGALGYIAQTIGGGGGFGAVTAASGISAAGVQFTLGSTGGVGGSADPSNGSTWTINSGTIMTSGLLSDALVAQAIGAGGGAAQAYGVSGAGPMILGASGGFFAAFDGPLLSQNVQAGAGGAGGNGGAVKVEVEAAIETTGAGAHGVIAQSVGGGGGVVGAGEFATTLPTLGSFAGSVGGAGSAGAVEVDATANIMALGANSTGIVAPSTDATGRGGPITVTVATGDIVAGGVGSGGTPGNGDEPANAVRLIGGAANTLTSHGYLTTVAGGRRLRHHRRPRRRCGRQFRTRRRFGRSVRRPQFLPQRSDHR